MPWQPLNHKVELLVENHGTAKKPRYRLTGFVRQTRASGETFLQPLPNFWPLRDLEFADIDIVPPAGTNRSANAGELSLTRQSAGGRFGGRKL